MLPTTWILVIVYTGMGQSFTGIAQWGAPITIAEFSTKERCEQAGTEIEAAAKYPLINFKKICIQR